MKRQIRGFLAALLGATVALTGCSTQGQPESGPGTATTETRRGGTFTFSYSTDPTSLDPQKTTATTELHGLIFDTLVVKGPDNNVHPGLAERWEVSPDGKVITFTLKQGVTFHNGEPFNAESVKFTFDRAVNPETKSPTSGGFLGPYEKTEVVSEYEAKVYFKSAYAPILNNLTTAFLAPLPPKAVAEKGDAFGREPVGTGAFKFESWQNSDAISLVKNPDWKLAPAWATNKGPSYLDRVVFKYVPDENSQMLALQNGEIDVLEIPGPQVEVARANPNFQIEEYTQIGLVYLGINTKKIDAKVRQAIASAVNREEVVENALFGMGVPNYTLISPAVFGFDESVKNSGWSFDLPKGAQLLTEAGYAKNGAGKWAKDGQPLTFEITTYTSQPYPRVAEVLQNQISKLGIDVTIRTLENASLQAMTPKGEHDSILIAYNFQDPDILFNFLHSSRLANTNRVHYVNGALDALLEQGRTTLDPVARKQIYRDVQSNVLQNAAWVPVYTNKLVKAVRKENFDVAVSPSGTVWLYDAYKEVK